MTAKGLRENNDHVTARADTTPSGHFSVFDRLWPPSQPLDVPPKTHTPNRRSAERYTSVALSLLRRLRLHPGIEVVLVDLPSSGVLVETRVRLPVTLPVRLIIETRTGDELPVDGVVLRSSLHSISPQMVSYRS